MSTDNEEKTEFSKASTVRVDDIQTSNSLDSDEISDEVVPHENKKKPFLGGYRNKATGVIYHHVSTQTIKSPWKYPATKSISRDSQTIETKNQIQQTPRNVSTQVEVRNICIQTSADKFTAPSDCYVSADEIQCENLIKIIFIQKYVRRWLAQRELKRLQQSMLDKLSWEEEQRKIREKQDLDWLRDLQKRKLHPIKEDDFLLLFSDLQNWWENEAEVISITKNRPGEQQDAMLELVHEEAKKISEINKIKSGVENEKSYNLREKNLIEAGRPNLWKGYKKKISVITHRTQKGKDLQDLYMTLSMKCISSQDRVDALHSLIQTIQKHNNRLTNTLLQLAQREIDLLLRGTKAENLEGLRCRIQDLFWQYVKQPIFNPQMQSLHNTKKNDGKEPYIFCCAGCKQFSTLPPGSINEAAGKGVMGNNFMKCKKCLYLENEGWIRKDNELYKKILKLLVHEEEKKATLSSIIYMLQPCDVKHLVEAVWKRQSCLSGATDEKELELVRYNVEEDWTPWNCMLVTREEAAILSGIPNPKESYDDQFKKFVYQRHIAARSYFATIPRFLPYVSKSIISKDYDSSSDSEND